MGALHGASVVFKSRGIGTFVECHDDIRAQLFLYGNGGFRGETVGGHQMLRKVTHPIDLAQPFREKTEATESVRMARSSA
jgi:hypothetical protein